jgi:hypothetical protein
MVTKMKKTKCMGTSKNKRAMSGGRGAGRVSRYTQKFKKCYSSFINIPESDADEVKNDNTKIKKIQEWGRLRGIYTYLKSRKLEEDDKTFLEKMKDNLGEDSYGKYTSAISCLENDSTILLKQGCVLENDYVNTKQDDNISIFEPEKTDDDEEKKKVEEERLSAAAEAERAAAEADRAAADAERAAAAVSNDDAEAETSEPPAPESDAAVSNDNDESGPSEPPAPESDAAVQNETNDAAVSNDAAAVSDDAAAVSTEAVQPEILGNDKQDGQDGQDGGRSKRKTKSSRRRGKSMKSKKGRRTRRR